MKLLVPPLKITETDGFKPEIDIFDRKAYGQSLYNLINKTQDELVLALDAPWGEGKSTFIKMWRGFLAENGNQVASVYFDAFENDYQQDPLLAISSQLYALIDKKDDSTKAEFKKRFLSALKIIGRASLRVGVKAVSAGVFDETILMQTGNVDDASDEASDLIDSFIEKQLTKSEENKKSLIAFKEFLSALGEKLGNGKNLVFIIDELDRCKPKFALAILESIKHLFSVPHITFVLVMNRTQLEEAVRCEYGAGVDASRYLQKFVSVWTSLPKSNNQTNPPIKAYLRHCLDSMNYETKTPANADAVDFFEELAM
ncbi:MAG: P-loop NTPase fold protein, partial [Methylophilus sp.]